MLKFILDSLNVKILLTLILLFFVTNVIGSVIESTWLIATSWSFILMLMIWMQIANKRLSIIFLSWIFKNKRAVELVSFDNTRYYTLASKLKDGSYICPVYFSSNIGSVLLFNDGTTDKTSKSSYIKYWLPLNKNDRAQHILTYGMFAQNDIN